MKSTVIKEVYDSLESAHKCLNEGLRKHGYTLRMYVIEPKWLNIGSIFMGFPYIVLNLLHY